MAERRPDTGVDRNERVTAVDRDPAISDPAVTPDLDRDAVAADARRTDGDRTPTQVGREPTLGELFTELSSDFSLLVRQEVQLARAETTETVKDAVRSSITMAAGGFVAYAGFLAILAGITIGVARLLDNWWVAALAVGAIVLVIGLILIFSGRAALSNLSITPEKTIQTLEDDAEWAKEKVNEPV